MTCIYRFQGAGQTINSLAAPGESGFNDIGCAVSGSVSGSAESEDRLTFNAVNLSNGRSLKTLKPLARPPVVGLTSFAAPHWKIKPNTYPASGSDTVTGPWSLRFYVRTPDNPATNFSFLSFVDSSSGSSVTNVSFVRANVSSTQRYTVAGSSTPYVIANINKFYRFEVQADPNRTKNLIWRIYNEDDTVPVHGGQESRPSVAWQEMRFGWLIDTVFALDIGEVELHDDYDLGGQFKSSPKDGVTPASTSATGSPSYGVIIPAKYNYNENTSETTPKYVTNPEFSASYTYNYASSPANYNRRLDLYIPTGTPPEGGWPIVCWAHGGFFVYGTRKDLPTNWRNDLLGRGYAVATIQYVKSADDLVFDYDPYGTNDLGGRYPSYIIDFKRACAWLRDTNNSAWQINKNKMIAAGFSAGGYIALAAAMSKNLDDDGYGNKLRIKEAQKLGTTVAPWADNYTGEDPSFIGCISYAGPVDMDLLNNWDPTYPRSVGATRNFAYRWFQGLHAAPDRSVVASNYPAQSIVGMIQRNSQANLCPVAYVYGTADYTCHWEHRLALKNALTGIAPYTEIETPCHHDQVNVIYNIEEDIAWFDSVTNPPAVSQQLPDPDADYDLYRQNVEASTYVKSSISSSFSILKKTDPQVVPTFYNSIQTVDNVSTISWTQSGTLDITDGPLSIEYLIVGGGGAGGSINGSTSSVPCAAGGGGAGNVLYSERFTLESGKYNIAIGDGGNGDIGYRGQTGSSTTAFGLTALGGGGGGGVGGFATGANGGSGGGAALVAPAVGNVAGGTGSGGFSGGSTNGTGRYAAGGGGAVSIGSGSSTGSGGYGKWFKSVVYGLGGQGGDSQINANGSTNLSSYGGGGNGASKLTSDGIARNGSAGRSGTVIIRWRIPSGTMTVDPIPTQNIIYRVAELDNNGNVLRVLLGPSVQWFDENFGGIWVALSQAQSNVGVGWYTNNGSSFQSP